MAEDKAVSVAAASATKIIIAFRRAAHQPLFFSLHPRIYNLLFFQIRSLYILPQIL